MQNLTNPYQTVGVRRGGVPTAVPDMRVGMMHSAPASAPPRAVACQHDSSCTARLASGFAGELARHASSRHRDRRGRSDRAIPGVSDPDNTTASAPRRESCRATKEVRRASTQDSLGCADCRAAQVLSPAEWRGRRRWRWRGPWRWRRPGQISITTARPPWPATAVASASPAPLSANVAPTWMLSLSAARRSTISCNRGPSGRT